jgi:hypothetical protein
MKKIIPTLILTFLISTSFAQGSKTELTCYTKYAQVFEKRGANEVLDGTYDNVIISIRKGSMADCFYGKVTVRNGHVDYENMFLKFEDETYEKLELQFKYKDKEKLVNVVNGISNVILTDDDELVNVLFVKNIKPKKKKYAKAAEPDFDL